MKGFSPRNLDYMLAFARAWPEEAISQQPLRNLPWGHNLHLLQAIDNPDIRLWYATNAVEYGWSRNVLAHHIDSKLYERQGKAATNFQQALPAPQSDLARDLLKDPYNFDFLTLSREAEERDIEQGLIAHLRKFLLELGTGFAFIGNQYRLEVGGDEFYIDLLFYHVRLHCYVVIELKATKFKPEYAGQLNFYLSAVDDLLRTESDAPTIGLLLCREKNHVVAEDTLKGMSQPMGISGYRTSEAMSETLKGTLPTIQQIEQELSEPRA